ncbi:helix-turn-helix domain-containing protein [Methylohalobius crimeensis]|uniref:helix-turn-helix domain-containing protein n=1 Tax=Methylohalobius crimeensis TaxID=244365 RepID=UPI000416688C|nr:helix-turn-helix domain-containing protein [Methylohalobius crimeensis]
MSVRQVKRLVRRYRDEGVAGLVSGHRGRRPNNALAESVRREVVGLVRDPLCRLRSDPGLREA